MSTFTVFVMKDKIILYFMTLTKSFLQGSPKAQTYLVIGKVPYKLLVLHVSNPSSIIPPWNTKIHNYVMFIFGFVNKYLASTSNVLLLHDDNHQGLRDIVLLHNYNYKIHSKWAIANSLHCTSPEFLSRKVLFYPKSSLSSKIFFQIFSLRCPIVSTY